MAPTSGNISEIRRKVLFCLLVDSIFVFGCIEFRHDNSYDRPHNAPLHRAQNAERGTSAAFCDDAPLKKWTSIYRYTSAVRIQLENNIPVLSVTFFCCKNG